MNAQQWGQLKELFAEARDMQPPQRRQFIRTRCASDPEIRSELEAMLDAHDCDDGFLAPLGADELQAASGITRSTLDAGTQIGPYEISHLIATGGMGEVYLARRADDSFEKHVAIKIIRQSIATVGMMQRFHRERQVLANLEHPNISRLLDGGTTDDGLPYLVMEFINGQPITKYCDHRHLTVRARLALFLRTCQAVQYAHQRLVVHRDIKPNNILVNGSGEVKLLDFGISRLLHDGDERHSPLTTITRSSALTPEYSSPEQVRGEAVTTSTDVYSLGVVLYEMLCGRRPFQLTDIPRYEAERLICETDPSLPSTVFGRNGRANDKRMRNQLRGDLDKIAVTALRKDPDRRYGSVEQFADDIRRYLDGQPITARKDTLGYRVGKFIRRNKPQVAAATIAGLATILALVSTTQSLSRANESERIAKRQSEIAQAAHGEAQGVVDFLETLLASASPFKRGSGVTVADLLSDAENLIESQLSGRPGVEANVRMALARTLRSLMMYAETIPHLQKSLTYFRANRDPDDPIIAECLSALAQSLAEQSFSGKQSSNGVVKMQQEALAIRRKHFGECHALVADNTRMLAIAMWAQLHPHPPGERIVRLFQDALAMYESLGLSESAGAARCRVDLANAYAARNEFKLAESAYVEALRVYDALPEGNNQFALDALDKYAAFLLRTDQPNLAVTVLETYRAKTPAGVNLDSTKNVVWRLASVHFHLGHTKRGMKMLRDAMVLECKRLRATHSEHAEELNVLMTRLQSPHDADGRIELFSDVLAASARMNAHDPRLVVDQTQIAMVGLLQDDGVASADRMLTRTAGALADVPAHAHLSAAINQFKASLANHVRTVDAESWRSDRLDRSQPTD